MNLTPAELKAFAALIAKHPRDEFGRYASGGYGKEKQDTFFMVVTEMAKKEAR